MLPEWCEENGHPGPTKNWEQIEKEQEQLKKEQLKKGVDAFNAKTAEILAENTPNTSARMCAGKPPLHYLMLFPTAIEAFAKVCESGANKYDYGNFLKGGKHWSEAMDSTLRHLKEYVRYCTWQQFKIDIGDPNEDGPPSLYSNDMGCHHLAHAMWNIMFELDMNNKGQTHDPKLFARMIEFWKSVKGLPFNEISARLEEFRKQTNKE